MAKACKQKPEKRKVRVVVSMEGGTIDAVYVGKQDSDLELDLVFVEASKYCDEEEEFEVESGPLAGECIFTHMVGTFDPDEEDERASAELFDGVFKAAQKRLDSFE